MALEYTKDEVEKRLRNPFWISFALAWIGWNWKIWYLTFFVDEKIVWNKLQYIEIMYSHMRFMNPLVWQLVWPLLNYLVAPGLISVLVIWFLPEITDKYLSRHQQNKEREDVILIKKLATEKKVLAAKEKVADQTLQTSKKEDAVKKKADLENQQDIWDKEYTLVIKKYPRLMTTLSKFIYESRGKVFDGTEWNNNGLRIDPNTESTLHLHGLINKLKDSSDQYVLTEKWKYFLKRASLE